MPEEERYIDEEFKKLDPWTKFYFLLFFFTFVGMAGMAGYLIGEISGMHDLQQCFDVVNALKEASGK